MLLGNLLLEACVHTGDQEQEKTFEEKACVLFFFLRLPLSQELGWDSGNSRCLTDICETSSSVQRLQFSLTQSLPTSLSEPITFSRGQCETKAPSFLEDANKIAFWRRKSPHSSNVQPNTQALRPSCPLTSSTVTHTHPPLSRIFQEFLFMGSHYLHSWFPL